VRFLLDTNFIYEWLKPVPNSGVIEWSADADEDRVFLSVVSLLEVRYGIERMTESARRKSLVQWLEEDLALRFEGRILAIDAATADVCGKLIAVSEARGRRLEVIDAFLAATAKVHQLTIVTRNTSDFDVVTKDLLNPWR
jgi:predicted nucleic acid-binding protein